MTTKLLEDIEKYIAYLGSNGLWITVHGQGIDGLLEHNIHRNPYCALVKTDSAAWQRCKQNQEKVFRRCGQDCLFGMCYAGMEEYVFFVNDKTFVSVSGYGIHKEKASERIHRLTQEYFLKETELLHVYENSLKHEPETMNSWLCWGARCAICCSCCSCNWPIRRSPPQKARCLIPFWRMCSFISCRKSPLRTLPGRAPVRSPQ